MNTNKIPRNFRSLSLSWDIEKILNYDTIKVSTDTVSNFTPASFELAKGETGMLFTLEVNDNTYFYESKTERDQDNARLLDVISKYKP